MTLVMDGVRRTGAAVEPAQPAGSVRKPRGMAKIDRRVRRFTRMDGVKRPNPIARPTHNSDAMDEPATLSRQTPSGVPAHPEAPAAQLSQLGEVAVTEPTPIAAGTPSSKNETPPDSRETLAPVNVLLEAESVAPSAPTPETQSHSIPWWRKSAIGFGMVAVATVAAGGASLALNQQRPVTARADTPQVLPAATSSPTPDPAAVAAAQETVALRQLVDNFAAAHPGKFGIVVKDLQTGATATSGADRVLISASLYKMFVAEQIFHQIDAGKLSYSQAAGSGTGRNIGDCLRVMINVSDNPCGHALGAKLGWGKQNSALRATGYTGTSLATPQKTTAQDVATQLERLYQGTLLKPGTNQRYLDLLKSQRVNNRLPQGLPRGTVIAHKTGDLDGYLHDAGIVYGPKTDYLIVVTSGPWKNPGTNPPLFAQLSKQVWNLLEK